MSDRLPLDRRPGLLVEAAESNLIARELGRMAGHAGLQGCVLISFTHDRVGVNSSGVGDFLQHMERLADSVLAAIDDGMYDPLPLRNSRAEQIDRIAQRLYDLRDSAPAVDEAQRNALDAIATSLSVLAGRLVVGA